MLGGAAAAPASSLWDATKPIVWIRRGTGLGVAIVHAVVERAGGFIELERAPGRGSEFRLLFPLLLPPAAASAV